MNKRDRHIAINTGGLRPGGWLFLLQWLRLLVLSLARINHYKPDKGFYKPIQSPQNHIQTEKPTKTQTLTAIKLTNMNPAHKYLKWSVLLLFAFMAKFATAQTQPGPYQFTGNDDVCIGQTKNYGVTQIPGSTYAWTISPGTEGVDWNLTINGNTITVKWLKSGTYTISVVETNADNCSGDAVQITVTVHDLPVCSITGPDNVCPGSTNIYNAPPGMTTYNWSISGDATISGATNAQTVSVVAENKCGSYTLTLIITNEFGCSSTCTQTFEIKDTQAPSITGTIATTSVEGCDASVVPNAETNVAGLETIGLTISDNCTPDANLLVSYSDVVSGTCELVITRTYTITDACGNTSTTQQVINVKRPAFTITDAPGTKTVNCPADALVAPVPPTVKDVCGNTLTPTNTPPTAGPTCEGDVVWTFTYTDCAGNTADWTYTYTVDMPAFTITDAPGTKTVNCPADALVAPVPPTVKDVCGNTLTPTNTPPTAGPTCEGDVVWTFTYTDCAGNTADWTYTYTVDMPAFTITDAPGTKTVNCPADALVAPVPPTVKDVCGNTLTPTNTPPTAGPTCEGDVVWTFTYTDCAGNTADWTYTYTVDMPAFTITDAPGTKTVNCPADALVAPVPPTVKDVCGNTLTPTNTPPTAGPTCEGDVVWTFTYTDCAGNTADWTYTYTVDMPAFTITDAPGTKTVNCPADALVAPVPPTVKDVCGNTLTPTNTPPTAGPTCEGDVVWTFTYTDCAGNTADWTYTYTVDMPAFTITDAPGTKTVNCPADALVAPVPPTVKDVCGNTLTPTNTPPTAGPTCEGDVVWTFTYTDCAGNTADWTYTYTVDMPAFTITDAPGTKTVNCPADALVAPVPPTVKDVCGNTLTPTNTPPTAGPTCEGDVVWTFTYTDCAGNTADWTYTYTVDMPAFTITDAPGTKTVNCPADALVAPVPPTVKDVCGNTLTPTNTPPTAGPTCEGDVVWTFTYTDCAGNTADWTYTYTVDMPAFTITDAPGTKTVNCPADALVAPVPPTVKDVCGNTLTPTNTPPTAGPTCEGDVVWTFTYTDCAGNTADWTYTYTVDMPAFTITDAPGTKTVNCPADALVAPVPPTVKDVCGNTLTPTNTPPTAGPTCEGDVVWTFTYTDCAGNTADWTYTYTVDMPAFTITDAPGTKTVNCPADALVAPVPPTVKDVCGNTLTPTNTPPTAGPTCEGDVVWTFTYTDCAGNTADWTYTYTVDMPAFTITDAPGTKTVNCPADALVAPVPPTVKDVCGNTLTPTNTPPTAGPTCEGDVVWTFTYTDCAGNTADWTYTYTVDMPAFTITDAPGTKTVNCPADALVAPVPPTVKDVCGNTLTPTNTPPTAGPTCEGDVVWTFTYTDCAGNTADWTYTYTVDMPAFTITDAPGTKTVNCPADALVAPVPPTVKDVCGNTLTPTNTPPTAGPTCEGDVVWTFTYTDCAGNTADWTYTYTVDMPAFTITDAPGTKTVNCPADALVAPVPPTVKDVCGNTLTPTNTPPTAGPTCEGDVVWTFTYTDCAGNTADWTYTYTVDMPAFTITDAPGTKTVNCPADALVAPVPPTVKDVCGNTLTPTNTPPTAGPTCEGDVVWTFTYTDCAGNTADWTYTYTVDMPAFTITDAPGTKTVNCPADALVAPVPPTVKDVCGNTLTPTNTPPTAGPTCEGDVVWTFTYTDCAGNTADWTYTYTVDMPAFTITDAPGTKTVNCPADALVAPVPPTVKDVCGNTLTPTNTPPTAGPTCEGDVVWTFTYTDCAGNTADWTYTYTVDMPAFTITDAPGTKTVNCPADALVAPVPPTVKDVCGNTLTPTNTPPTAGPTCEGDVVWTFTYTDCAGNTADWTYTYTVDMPAFTITDAPGTKTVNCPADALVAPVPPTVKDVCGNTLTPTNTPPTAGPTCEGDVVWTFTYTDCAGNTADWTYTYTVDMPAFTITDAPGTKTVNCPADALVAPVPPTVKDVCGNTLTPTNTPPTAGPTCEGDVVWTFTYTDCAGNTADWTYTYTVDMPAFTITDAPGTKTVNCPADALVAPVPPTVKDVCGNTLTPTNTPPTAGPTCEGDVVWTFTYTDCAGNTADWTYTYTVDMPAFTITDAPGTKTVNCPADALVAPVPPTVKDVCGNTLTPTNTPPTAGPTCEGDVVWTFTYTDCAGNTADWTYTYTVDMPAFTITDAPGTKTVNCPADALVAPVPPTVKDVCGNTLTPTNTPPTAGPTCEGDVVWTFTYTDCAGNTADWTYTYTVDMPAFTITDAPGTKTVNCPADALVAPVPPTVKDVCGNTLTPTNTPPTAGPTCEGDVVWTFTYTDCAGNTADWTYTYTVDMPAFTITDAPGTKTVNCPADALVAPVPPTVKDVCGNTLTPTNTPPTAGPTCEGDVVWTFTYTDCAGNTADWTYTYTVDMPAFTITDAPGTKTVNCPADALVAPVPPTVKDVCGNTLTPTNTPPTAGPTCEGDVVWTFTYTDCAGNTADWTYTYTVDMPAFTITDAPGTKTVNCPADALVAPVPPTVKDVCGNTLTPTNTPPTAGPTCEGDVVWTFTYTDCAGNTADWTYTYTVDMPAFTITDAPGTKTVNCPADALVAPVPPTVKDVCGNTLTPTNTPPTAGPTCEGDVVWTFTYTDCAGNTADWTYTYTVDMPAFTITDAPGTKTVNCPADALVAPVPPTVKDVCGNTLTPTNTPPTAGPTCEGDVVWTFTYTDCAGNTADWTYTYTVDMPAFTITDAPGTKTVNCPADALVAPVPPTVKDVCGNTLTPTNTPPTAGPTCEGDVVWTFTYTDCAGNTADWTYTYTVDMPAFTITDAPGTKTVNCPADALVAPVPPTVKDVCGNTLTPTNTPPTAGPTCEGDVVWTFTYTDCAGNTADWTYTYTVDMPAFTITDAPGTKTVNCPADALVAPVPPTVKDVCGNTLTPTNTPPTAGPTCEGDVVWTFTYTDCAGNTADWTYTYTVDMPAFTITDAPGTKTVNCPADALVAPVPPTVKDVCGNTLTPTNTPPTAGPTCEGDVVWTFTYTDCAGNTADWTYTYTVDMPAFTITDAPGTKTVNCPADALVAPVPPTVKDVCGNTLTPTNTPPTAGPTCEGDVVWTFTYTDCAGNTADWTYTYTVDMPAFTITDAPGTKTVNCPADALVAPVPPTVKDVCGNTLTPTNTPPTAGPTCEGDVVWTFTYTDCAGNTADWTYTYTVDMPAFTITDAPGTKTVNCPADALVAPVPPTVKDVCGNTLTPTNTPPTAGPTCEGDVVWTFTYTDCAGNTADWTYTYTVDILPPQITSCPSDVITCETEAGAYVIPTLAATDNCGKPLTITYDITGATDRNGTGDASGAFGVGTSTIVWTVSNGCATSTCSTTVTINPLPAPTITPSQDPVCANTGTVTYSTPQVGCNTYSWIISEGGTIIGSSTGNSIVVQWTTAGVKTVTVTETMCGTGCTKTVSKDFTVNPKPITTPITHD